MSILIKGKFVVIFIVFLIFSVSCDQYDSNTTPLDKKYDGEDKNIIYHVKIENVPVIRFSGSEFDFPNNNCGSPVNSLVTFQRSREFLIDVEFGLTDTVIGEIGGGVAKVAEAKIGLAIQANINMKIGSVEKIEFSRQIETPAQSITIVTLQWEEVWTKGNVSVIGADGKNIGNVSFLVLTALNLSQKRIVTVKCGTDIPTIRSLEPTAVIPTVTRTPTVGTLNTSVVEPTILPSSTPFREQTLQCGSAIAIGPWSPIDGQGRNIDLDSGSGYIHADFWSPSAPLKNGFDEVSVILPPGTRVTVIGVAGQGWRYDSSCTAEYVNEQVIAHQERRRLEGKRITTISISELPTR